MVALLALALFQPLTGALPEVKILRTPHDGIQPQAAVSDGGRVHLIYYTGAPEAGDIFYVTSKDDGATWSKPAPVNTIPKAAIAIGNIRGAQMAVDKAGNVAVVWNGSKEAAKAMKTGAQAPLLVSCLPTDYWGFTYALKVEGSTRDLDGGATVAIDDRGIVGVFWHAAAKEGEGEAKRAVWMAQHSLGDFWFTRPTRLEIGDLGACGCCSMKAIGNAAGFTILYRSATESTKRDTWRLNTVDGTKVEKERIDPWNLNFCPMSSFGLAATPTKTWMAWETEGKIRVGARPGSGFTEVSASGKAKHPALATSGGYTLCAWTEGMGWQRGGTLRWALLDKDGKSVRTSEGDAGKVPVWSLVTAFVRRDGGFSIVY